MRKKVGTLLTCSVLIMSMLVGAASCSTNAGGLKSDTSFFENGIKNVTSLVSRESMDEFAQSNLKISEKETSLSLSGECKAIVRFDSKSILDAYLEDNEGYSSVAEFSSGRTAQKLKNKAESERSAFFAALKKKGISYEEKHSYNVLFNGVSLEIDANDFDKLESFASVSDVVLSNSYSLPESVDAVSNEVTVYGTGIYDSSKLAYKGEGMVVGVLDTGIDYTHEAFATAPESPALSKEDVAAAFAVMDLPNADTVEDVYISEKLPFAYDFADEDADAFPSYSSHGAHVSGIVAGRDDSTFFNGESFVGVAPEAQIATFKVFSDYKQGAETDDILAGLSAAVLLGVDVINMSLGSTSGFTRADDKEYAVDEVYDKVAAAGITLVVAASNSASAGSVYGTNFAENPDAGTVGSPSTYSAALSVASISGQLSPYIISGKGTAVYFYETRTSTAREGEFVKELLGSVDEKTYKYVVIPGYGADYNYTNAIKSVLAEGGYIALVSRGGDISFEDKMKSAAKFGAVGCMIYNNESGMTQPMIGSQSVIPTCFVDIDTGSTLVSEAENYSEEKKVKIGTLTFKEGQAAGPFMSSFSSYGPTSDLKMVPEITAHGGDIMSSVVGGYDEFSGTSMAAPNLAGVATLLRQYLKTVYPDASAVQLNQYINQYLMSTATIIRDEAGNPYFVRRQGSGLGDIYKAIETQAYLYVEGSDKTKIELGDDKNRTGIYTLRFHLKNTASVTKSYKMNTYALTDQLSSNGISVREKSYMLEAMSKVKIVSGSAQKNGDVLTVAPNADVSLEVTLTLTSESKAYLNETFKNGYYVEGFVEFIDQATEKAVDLSIPYLAFYGNWLDAPLFDYTEYEVSADALDDSVEDEDKRVASSYATKVFGKYYHHSHYDNYITDGKDEEDDHGALSLGEYAWTVPSGYAEVESSSDKIAIGGSTYGTYGLYYVRAGLLRNAKTIKVTITEDATGEVVYEETETNLRKSTGSGSFVVVDFDSVKNGLKNNAKYTIRLEGAIDYDQGEKVTKNVQEFDLYIDYQAPEVIDSEIRTTYDAANNRHVYLDVYVYDNHYTQALYLSTVKGLSDEGYLRADPLTDDMIPVYSSRNNTTKVTVEITNYLDQINNAYGEYRGKVAVTIYDYAMNSSFFSIPVTMTEMDSLVITTDEKHKNPITESVQMKVGEEFKYYVKATLNGEETDDHDVNVSFSEEGIVEVKNGVVHALKAGETTLTLTPINDKHSDVSARITIVVAEGELKDADPKKIEISSFSYEVEDEEYHDVSVLRRSISGSSVYVDCGNTYAFEIAVTPWYATAKDVQWKVGNELYASVDENGVFTAKKEGAVTLEASCYVESTRLTLRTMITVVIGEEYNDWNGSGYLIKYKGLGGTVVIPEDAGYYYISYFPGTHPLGAFQDNQDIDVVYVPQTVHSIGAYSFYNSSVRVVYLPSTIESIESSAFENCKNLEAIYWIKEDALTYDTNTDTYEELKDGKSLIEGVHYEKFSTTKQSFFVGKRAFYGCEKLESFDFSKVGTVYEYAFANCTALKSVNLEKVSNVKEMAFSSCSSIESLVIPERIAIGDYAFSNCDNLTSVDYYKKDVSDYAFFNCKKLQSVRFFNKEMGSIGEYAFYNDKNLESVTFDGAAESIKRYAFYGTAIESIRLPDKLMNLGSFAFAENERLTTVTVSASAELKELGSIPFYRCGSLTTVSVEDGSKTFENVEKSQKGVVYTYLRGKGSLANVEFFIPESYNTVLADDLLDSKTAISSEQYSGREFNENNSWFENGVLTIPEGIESIGEYAFNSAKGIKIVILPSTLKTLERCAFFECVDLEKVVFKSDIAEIPEYAFAYCSNLKEVELPYSLKSIGAAAFAKSGLESISIPKNVKTIEKNAFASSSLNSVEWEENSALKSIGESAFANCPLETVVLPEGLVSLGDGAFKYCTLREAYVPGTVKEFGESVFSYCLLLEKLEFGEGLEKIGDKLLYSPTESGASYIYHYLEEIVVPSTLKEIGSYAFGVCLKLKTLDFSHTQLVEIGERAFFANTALEKLILPKSTQKIGQYAFLQSESLCEANLENVQYVGLGAFNKTNLKGVLNLDKATFVGAQAFSGTGVTELNAPELLEAEKYAFAACEDLVKVKTPKLERIGKAAFYLTSIEEFAFSKNFEKADEQAFVYCSKLKKFSVDEGNKKFFADEYGVVYRRIDAAGTKLEAYAYPAGSELKEYSVRAGTIRIAAYAFATAEKLQTVNFPESLLAIGHAAFYLTGWDYVTVERNENNQISKVIDVDVYFNFTSEYAPELEGEYSEDERGMAKDSFHVVYANFINSAGYGFNPHFTYPANGKGYTTLLWSDYSVLSGDDTEDDAENDENADVGGDVISSVVKNLKTFAATFGKTNVDDAQN